MLPQQGVFNMRRYLRYSIVVGLLLVLQTHACDVCNMYDYTGRQNQSFIGFFYRYRVMNGYSDIMPQSHRFVIAESDKGARADHEIKGEDFYHNKTNADFQKYHVADVRFNYALGEKANIGCIVPLMASKAYYKEIFPTTSPMTDSTITTQSLGDVMLFADYVFSWQKDERRAFLKPGFALKLPTGNSYLGKDGILYPHELQGGTGTWDLILRLNANIRGRHLGAEWISNYRINTKHATRAYKFGNTLNLMLNAFYVVDLTEELALVPKLGAYIEQAAADDQQRQRQADTGGHTTYGNLGLDLMYNRIYFQTMFQKPVYDRLNGSQIGNAGRLVFGVVYNL